MTHRILLGTVGKTPQVMTETLYRLTDGEEPWIPDRVEIVTTGVGIAGIREAWPKLHAALAALFPAGAPPLAIYAAREGDGGAAAIEWPGGDAPDPVWPGPEDRLRADIVSVGDVEAVGDLIKDRVWTAARRADSELHLSIAGGRKTMSAHALLSLALLGRPQDDASHILVAPPFEENTDFWHPRQGWLINTSAELRAAQTRGAALPPPSLDPSTAELTLIRTPAPFVAEMPTDREALGRMRFSDLLRQVDLAKRFLARPSIAFDDATRTVTVCGLAKTLSGKSYVQLRLLARAMRERWPGVGREGRGGVGWLTLETMIGERGPTAGLFENALATIAVEPSILTPASRRNVADIVKALRARRLADDSRASDLARDLRGALVGWLKSMKMTDLRDDLVAAFGPLLARAVLPEASYDVDEERRIGLGCGPEAIAEMG